MHIPRPAKFKQYHGSHVRLKTKLFDEADKEQSQSLTNIHVLEQILLPAYGVTSVKFHGHQSEMLWSFPSAGACYPIELYVAIRTLEGVPPGIYYYAALQASLYKVRDFEEGDQLEQSLLAEDREADFYFIVTTVPWRSCWKYSYKGYRFSFIDAGHVTANFQLILDSMGMRTNIYTGMVSDELRTWLQLNPYEDLATVIAVHTESDADQEQEFLATDTEQREAIAQRAIREEETAAAYENLENLDRPSLARRGDTPDAGMDTFDWHPIFSFREQVNRYRKQTDQAWLSSHELPLDWLDYEHTLKLMIQRRSSSAYSPEAISHEVFHRMLQFMQELEMPGISIYLFIHAVKEIPPGIYRWDGNLVCLKQGEFRELSASLCLGQMFVRDCSVLFLYAVDSVSTEEEASYSLYQQRLIDAGIMGQLVYLKSQEMGLGYSAIGGYYDEEVREVLDLTPERQVIYAGTWGIEAEEEGVKHDRYRLNEDRGGY